MVCLIDHTRNIGGRNQTNLRYRCLAGRFGCHDTPQELPPLPLERRPGVGQSRPLSRGIDFNTGPGFRLYPAHLRSTRFYINLDRIDGFWAPVDAG